MGSSEVIPSPNIWRWPDVYEQENRAQDIAGAVWSALKTAAPWDGRDVVDLGCGDGFHAAIFAATARTVTGIEPYLPLVSRAHKRLVDIPNVQVISGSAQRIPLPDSSADLVHARTAYFFGAGCEPGIAEALRVLRPDGVLAIVDLDGMHEPYGRWLCANTPNFHPRTVEKFFIGQGFSSQTVETIWRFPDRQTLAAVLRIEFSPHIAQRALTEITGLEIPVGYRIRLLVKPAGLLLP